MIIVPSLLLLASVVTLVTLCLLRCGAKQTRTRTRTTVPRGIDGEKHSQSVFHLKKNKSHANLVFSEHAICTVLPKAPAGINPLEHEELQMSQHVQQRHQNVRPTLTAVPRASMEQYRGVFSLVRALPLSFSIKADNTVSLYRARVDNRNVILRVLKGRCCALLVMLTNNKYTLHVEAEFRATLKRSQCCLYLYSTVQFYCTYCLLIYAMFTFSETANDSEKQHFLGFASFLSGLGPHPFLPTLLGMISVQPPLTMVMEELQHQDLLGYLWKCRQVEENLPV